MAASAGSRDDVEQKKAFERLSELSKPSLIAARSLRRDICKMANLCSDMLYHAIVEWSQEAGESPAMLAYSGDGTPVSIVKRVKIRLWGKHGHRQGRNTDEYYIQSAFFRFLDQHGQHHTRFLCAPPLALTKGLGADAQFAAGCRFSKTLRERGHRGIVLNVYVFDRKGIERLARFYVRRHTEAEEKWGEDEGESWTLSLMEWTLIVACALHDLHNGLKWSLFEVFQSPAMIKDTWIIFQSVRNSFDDVQRHIPLWLLTSVSCEPDALLPAPEQLASFWKALGLEDDKVQKFAHELRLFYDPASKVLKVSASWAGQGENVMETLTSVVLFFLECKSFSESRWASVQGNAQMMVCLVALGVRSLIEFVRDQPNMLKEHIHGFEKLDGKQISFLVHAMFAGRVVDRALLMLMKDNRLALIADRVKEALQEEIDKVESTELVVFEQLAALCGDGSTGFTLRSSSIKACHVGAAFFHWRALSKVDQYPWCLARGDHDANLDRLLAGEEPQEATALKIYTALKRKVVGRKAIKRALQLLLQVPWTTLTAEQGHAALSTIRQCRDQLGQEQACLRAFLSFLFKSTPKPTVLEQQRERIVSELQVLGRKNPNMMRPGNFYFQDIVALSHQLEAPGKAKYPPQNSVEAPRS